MAFEFYKSKSLVPPDSGSPIVPPQGMYVKSDVSNVNDGGTILRVSYGSSFNVRTINFVSGSITSSPAVSQQISQFVSQISSSDSPYVTIPEAEFNTQLSDYESYFNSL